MNLFEAQDIFAKMNPGKNITFEFDDKCVRQIECIYTEGKLHPDNHVQYEHLKVTVEGNEPIYVPIMPHRAVIRAEDLKGKLTRDEVYVKPQEAELVANA